MSWPRVITSSSIIGTLPFCASGMCWPASCQFPPTASGSLIALAGLERRRLVWQCSALASKGPIPSEASINRARREATARGLKVEFRIDDMRNLSTAPIDSYDAIIAMDNAVPHLQSDDDIKMAFGAIRARLRSGGIVLISLRDYGPLMAQRASSTPVSLYFDGEFRRFVHQVWDWQDDRRYVVHLFITMQKPDGWHTRHFVGQYRAITPSDVAALAVHAGFDDVRVLAPDETGYYQPVIRAVAPRVSSSG